MLGLILTLKCSNFGNRFKLRINLNQKKISPYIPCLFKGTFYSNTYIENGFNSGKHFLVGNTINYSSFENAY